MLAPGCLIRPCRCMCCVCHRKHKLQWQRQRGRAGQGIFFFFCGFAIFAKKIRSTGLPPWYHPQLGKWSLNKLGLLHWGCERSWLAQEAESKGCHRSIAVTLQLIKWVLMSGYCSFPTTCKEGQNSSQRSFSSTSGRLGEAHEMSALPSATETQMLHLWRWQQEGKGILLSWAPALGLGTVLQHCPRGDKAEPQESLIIPLVWLPLCCPAWAEPARTFLGHWNWTGRMWGSCAIITTISILDFIIAVQEEERMRDSKGSSIYIHINQSYGAERGEIQETKQSPPLWHSLDTGQLHPLQHHK